jgi:hypothetical protein
MIPPGRENIISSGQGGASNSVYKKEHAASVGGLVVQAGASQYWPVAHTAPQGESAAEGRWMKTQWQVSRPRCFKKLRFDAKPR